LDPSISVTGTVVEIRKKADSDIHNLFALDQTVRIAPEREDISRQHGDLILEPICQGKVRQADAVEACGAYTVLFLTEIGQRYI